MSDGYREALEAGGATVHVFESFGSYQGDWWARVSLSDGRSGWVHGYFGSCSGCDAFEAEFNYREPRCKEHRWEADGSYGPCDACAQADRAYRERLAAFGRGYLADLLTQDEAEREAKRGLDWDLGASPMLDFLKAHR